jgi:predicted RNA binding protein YcfA (HicA-like mRNA interferase family)
MPDRLTVRELIRLIEDDGWFLNRTRGSHRQFKHAIKKGTVTIAGKPSDTVHPKTLSSVLKQAQLEDE